MLSITLIAHRTRFILPILSLTLILCGDFLNSLHAPRKNAYSQKGIFVGVFGLVLIASFGFIVYFSAFHQRGTLDAVAYLQRGML